MRSFLRTLLFAVLPITLFGEIAGFAIGTRFSTEYRSTSRLIVESDEESEKSYSLATVSALAQGDKVLSAAFDQPGFEPFRESYPEGSDDFVDASRSALQIESETDPDANPLVVLLSYHSEEPGLSEAALRSVTDSLIDMERQRNGLDREEDIKLIADAKEKLQPKIAELEKRYRDFRRNAPLVFNKDGESINPHLERQLFLVQRRSDLYEELRRNQVSLTKVEAIVRNGKDPIATLSVISQVLGIKVDSKPYAELNDGIETDISFAPVPATWDLFFRDESHPKVKNADAQLEVMKEALEEKLDRAIELMKVENAKPHKLRKREFALEAMASVIYASKAEVQLLERQVADVDSQIQREKTAAKKLVDLESKSAEMIREINQSQAQMNQLEDQMSRAEMRSKGPVPVKIAELVKPSKGYITHAKNLNLAGIGGAIGFVISSLIALMIYAGKKERREPSVAG